MRNVDRISLLDMYVSISVREKYSAAAAAAADGARGRNRKITIVLLGRYLCVVFETPRS